MLDSKRATELRFRPFPPLGSESGRSPEARLTDIRELIDAGAHTRAIEQSMELIKLGLEGLRYLQTYVRPFFLYCTPNDLCFMNKTH